MSDNLVIGGATFTGVTGIKATDTNDNVVTFESGGWTASDIANGTVTGIADITLTPAKPLRQYAFENCTGITKVIVRGGATSVGFDQYAFRNCTGITEVDTTNIGRLWFATNAMAGCTSIKYLKKIGAVLNASLANCTSLLGVDMDPGETTTNGLRGSNGFAGCTKMKTLIIRDQTVVTALANINYFNNTPFASGKAGGTLYVPQDLIASYEAATNWSTILGYANNSIQAIEGSIYETQYVDGTPIPTT